MWIWVYKYFSQLPLLLCGSIHLCFMLFIGTKVLVAASFWRGWTIRIATGLALMQYLLLVLELASLYLQQYWLWCSSNYLSTDISVFHWHSAFSAYFCLISKQNIHFFFHKISYTLFIPQFNTLIFCFLPREETTNERSLHVPDSTHSIYKLKHTRLPYQPTVQGLSFETPLSRGKFHFMPDKKSLPNFSERAWYILEFGSTVNLDKQGGEIEGFMLRSEGNYFINHERSVAE